MILSSLIKPLTSSIVNSIIAQDQIRINPVTSGLQLQTSTFQGGLLESEVLEFFTPPVVSKWIDYNSGSNRDLLPLAESIAPSNTQNAINNHPALDFRTNKALRTASGSPFDVRTVFFVASYEKSSGSALDGIFSKVGVDAENIRIDTVGTNSTFRGNTNTTVDDFTHAGGRMRINGQVGETITVSTPFIMMAESVSTISIDVEISHISAAALWQGFIGEILIYDRVLTAGEIALVEGYLSAKWNVTLS